MRSPSLLAPTCSLARRLWGILSVSAALASALTITAVPQPSFNLDGLGHVGLAGDFNAISIYEYQGQTGSSAFLNGSESLLQQLPNGIFTSLASADGAIQALCVHELKDGTVKGVFVGGNFTSLGNVQARGVALFNPQDGKVTALDVLVGKVNALLCDKETNTVYVGGDFVGSKSCNAIAWVDGKGWTDLPFDGFDQPVKTISKSPNNKIVFGGTFNNLVNASSPRVRHAQTINLVSANITAEQTTSLSGFNDPASIVCSTGKEKQWLLGDGQKGSWTASFGFLFKPTKIRIRNANHEGRGTKLFRFRFAAFPVDGIMNLTYTDPATNTSMNCDAWCPLSATEDFQDFFFVNEIGMNRIRIDILDYYGAGGGLAGIELFQDDIFSFAASQLNEPSCGGVPAKSGSIITGQWTETKGPEADSEYLSISLSTAQLSSASVVFEPHIQQSGDYVVLMHTPGCRQDNSCSTRGQVNVTGTYTKSGPPQSAPPYYQTNDFDKYDTVYRGFVDAADDTFRPRVTLTPMTSQSFPVVNIVAQKVQFQMLSNTTANTTSEDGSDSPSLELNGLYEFDPKQTSVPKASDVAKSVISTAGRRLRAGAKIKAVVPKDDLVYVAGEFSAKDDSFQHIFTIGPNGVASVIKGGLDAPIDSILLQGDLLYVGGQFQNTNSSPTTGLGFVAAYHTKTKEWAGLGAGVDGCVKELVPITLNLTRGRRDGIAVSGNFTMIRADSANPAALNVHGFAVWIPSEKQWLERMSNETISLGGVLSASVPVPNSYILYSGSVTSQTDTAPGAVSLRSKNGLDVQAFPVQLTNQGNPAKRKRSIVSSGFAGVVTGAFYLNDGKNYTILGGHFSAHGNSGTVNNIAIIDGKSTNNSVIGVGNQLDSSSTVLSMLVVNSTLFVGGSITGRVADNNISGIAGWDLSTMSFAKNQPVGLQGSNGVEVHAITRPPTNNNQIYIGGKFDSAGSLPCAGLCIFNVGAGQWNSPQIDMSGQVNVLYWVDVNTLLVGGDMKINNTATYLAIYDARARTINAFQGDITNIPGPVASIAVNADTIDSIFISGSATNAGAAYVMKLKKGGKFEALTGLGDNTIVRNVQVLQLSKGSGSNDFLDDNQVLVAMGSLNLSSFGNASAATFDGANWKPLFLTSTADDLPGTIVSLFSEKQQKFSPGGKKLAKGFAILISLAIALGLVFLLVCLGVLASYIRRRREGYVPMPSTPSPRGQSPNMQERLPPSSLFSSIGPDSGRSSAPVI